MKKQLGEISVGEYRNGVMVQMIYLFPNGMKYVGNNDDEGFARTGPDQNCIGFRL